MQKNKKKWVYIEWRDAYNPTFNGWMSPSDVEEELLSENSQVIIQQVGILLHKNKHYTTLTHQLSNTQETDGSSHIDAFGAYTRIPNKCIITMQDLNVVESISEQAQDLML